MDPIEEAVAKVSAEMDGALAQYDEELVESVMTIVKAIEDNFRLQRSRGLSQEIAVGGIGGCVATTLRRCVLDDQT